MTDSVKELDQALKERLDIANDKLENKYWNMVPVDRASITVKDKEIIMVTFGLGFDSISKLDQAIDFILDDLDKIFPKPHLKENIDMFQILWLRQRFELDYFDGHYKLKCRLAVTYDIDIREVNNDRI